MSYYALLNVSETATIKEITRAYRAKARETHPDMGGDKELFQNIQEAYSVLKHPESRARYDRKLNPSAAMTFNDFLATVSVFSFK